MGTSLLTEALWVLLTRLGLRAANFVAFVLLARSLTTEALGLYGYIVATQLMLSVAFDAGLRQSAASFMGRDEAARAAIVTHLGALGSLLGFAACLATVVALALGGYGAAPRALLVPAALTTGAMLLLRTGQGLFLGLGRIKDLNRSELVTRSVLLPATVGLWLAGRLTVETAVWTLLLAHAAAAAWLTVQFRGLVEPRRRLELRLARDLMRRGLVFAGGIILVIVLGRINVWIVNARLDAEAVGVYFGLMRFSEMLAEVATAIGIVIFSHGVRNRDARAAAAEAVRTARTVLFMMMLVAATGAVAAEPFLRLMLGETFAAEAPAFRVMLAGTVVGCLATMLYPSLSAQGYARFGTYLFGPGVVAAGGLGWVLAPAYGLKGAALALLAAQLLVAAGCLLVYRCLYGFGTFEMVCPQRADLARTRPPLRRP